MRGCKMQNDKGSMPDNAVELIGKGNANFAKKKAIRVANEIAQRRLEALNLYVPQPVQEEFH